MKKILISACLFFLLLPAAAGAAPFLVCDSQAGVNTYLLEVDGATITTDTAAQPDGSLKYDLAPLALEDGNHTIRLQACNAWDCSEFSVPFVFNKQRPGTPLGLRLSKN